MDALKTGNHRHFVMGVEAVEQARAIHRRHTGRAVRVRGFNRDLPALPRAGRNAHFLQDNRQKAGGHLLARGHNRVIFTRVVEFGAVFDPSDQLVGLACHGRNHNRNLIAGIDLALHMPCNIADPVHIPDGGTAEFHHETCHARLFIPDLERGSHNCASL